jgi:hypothetical protein
VKLEISSLPLESGRHGDRQLAAQRSALIV